MPDRLRGLVVALTTVVLNLPLVAQDPGPQFEVATLKLSPPPSAESISINLGTFRNGRLTLGNVTLDEAMLFAFDLPSKEMLVGLDWTDSVRFDVEGLAPPETPQPQLRLRARRLLEERLHLVGRHEQRTIRHLALVVGRDGRKFKDAVGAPVPTVQARGRIDHKRMPMRLLASLLSRFEQQLVVDRTGLDGVYEVQLEWAPDTAVAPADPGTPPPDRPSLSTALQEQLGLRLEGRREPLEVVVVQSASRVPEPN
jgi:uncharacterized protein (TIGR03435 family)